MGGIQFSHKTQSEYYDANEPVSIECIALEKFSASHHTSPLLASDHVSLYGVFYYYLSDESYQDSATTAVHSKCIIELLQNRTVLFDKISTIGENMDGCAEHYPCTTALYLFSMLSQVYNNMIDRGVVEPGHGREVFGGLNDTKKWLISMLITTVLLSGASDYD